MAIYTRKGDKGKTGVFSPKDSKSVKVSKSSSQIEAIGSIDEANTFLGLAASFTKNKKIKSEVKETQRHLFEVGAYLAGARLQLDTNLVSDMEKRIDKIDKVLPKLKNFILPGGGQGGALLFMARTFIRRAERSVVNFSGKRKIDPIILIYLNRLSDYIYILARYSNFKEKTKEEAWSR